MALSLVALDYSRPIRALFEQIPGAGIIHGVFHRVINIAIDDTIVAVLSSDLPRIPNGLRVTPLAVEEMLSGLKPGIKVYIGDRKLLIPSLQISLQLPDDPPWEPKPDMSAEHWNRETVALHSAMLARYLSSVASYHGVASLVRPLLLDQPSKQTPLTHRALPLLQQLAYASKHLDIACVEQVTCCLAGLGPGLTPSGDDALAGFIAAMTLLGPYMSDIALHRDTIAMAIASTARSRTNTLSAVLLAYAARGEVAEPLGTLLLALALPLDASDRVRCLADRVLAFGGTSGGDTLLGLLLGVRSLENRG